VRGLFIVLEGPEGSGKSTQLSHLATRLSQLGREPVITREPGGTPAGDAIRQVLLDPSLTVAPLTEFLLYSASRAQHVAAIIRPALATGRLVISDRFFGASIAYQGYGRGLELAFITELNERVTGGLKPDLTLLFDLEPQRGLGRIAARGSKDRLEQADLAFHQRVREGFLQQSQADPSWIVLDATLPQEVLAEAVWECVEARLP